MPREKKPKLPKYLIATISDFAGAVPTVHHVADKPDEAQNAKDSNPGSEVLHVSYAPGFKKAK
jgi:hypothetical protein